MQLASSFSSMDLFSNFKKWSSPFLSLLQFIHPSVFLKELINHNIFASTYHLMGREILLFLEMRKSRPRENLLAKANKQR